MREGLRVYAAQSKFAGAKSAVYRIAPLTFSRPSTRYSSCPNNPSVEGTMIEVRRRLQGARELVFLTCKSDAPFLPGATERIAAGLLDFRDVRSEIAQETSGKRRRDRRTQLYDPHADKHAQHQLDSRSRFEHGAALERCVGRFVALFVEELAQAGLIGIVLVTD